MAPTRSDRAGHNRAEDGRDFLTGAVQGVSPLGPYDGYLHVVPRLLAAGITATLPGRLAASFWANADPPGFDWVRFTPAQVIGVPPLHHAVVPSLFLLSVLVLAIDLGLRSDGALRFRQR